MGCPCVVDFDSRKIYLGDFITQNGEIMPANILFYKSEILFCASLNVTKIQLFSSLI